VWASFKKKKTASPQFWLFFFPPHSSSKSRFFKIGSFFPHLNQVFSKFATVFYLFQNWLFSPTQTLFFEISLPLPLHTTLVGFKLGLHRRRKLRLDLPVPT